jgi:ubiquinone/menaquinone biosynthesis C-methylase UbiE
MTEKIPTTNIEWKAWGDYDPLMDVAGWSGKSKDDANPWNDSESYKLGESDWKDFLAYWERYGVDRSSVLELGCGTGRITMQLAKYFKVVHAVDVSEGMIAYAQKYINSSTVYFHLTNGIEIPLPDNSVSAIFSCHVFQHFNSIEHATKYFKEISRVLQPKGSIMIHLPILAWPCGIGQVIPMLYRLRKAIGDVKIRINRFLLRRYNVKPMMQMISYLGEYVYNKIAGLGYTNIEIIIFPTKSNGGLHPFVFAKYE